jgi:hypothetical protein
MVIDLAYLGAQVQEASSSPTIKDVQNNKCPLEPLDKRNNDL